MKEVFEFEAFLMCRYRVPCQSLESWMKILQEPMPVLSVLCSMRAVLCSMQRSVLPSNIAYARIFPAGWLDAGTC